MKIETKIHLDGMIGKKFHKLLVTKLAHVEEHTYNKFYECVCECGESRICNGSDLRLNRVRRCKSCKKKMHRTHGMKGSSIWVIWMGIKARILNPKNRAYKNYGGRGLTMDPLWHKFDNFYRDMGNRPDGMQIDRIDNDLGYYKDNCHWVTPKENCSNRRRKKDNENRNKDSFR